jgi:ElaB/YqjD/DUF883 family membrane-anchored ribosome-binding protein
MEYAASKTEAQGLSEKAAALKQDFADVVRLGKERAVTGARECAKAHPAATLGVVAGVAAGIGLAIGLLVGRQRN